ncbi:MAG: glycosyltransferase [Anaerolineaceae bacterium]|nr:glycosyltransferase [Anaerolineaceae bacterium]
METKNEMTRVASQNASGAADDFPAGFTPARILDVEIGQPLPDLPAVDAQVGQVYRRARLLVRLHGEPLGTMELSFGIEGLSARELAGEVWNALSTDICDHLSADGESLPEGLNASGIISHAPPACIQAREAFLERAPFASVVIATHDRTESLAGTLEALLDMDYPHFEVIVVDNAPGSDQTAEFVRQTYAGNPQIRYTREEYPGLAAAHNRGLSEVNASYVAFTDDDVLVDRFWLAEMMRGFEVMDRVGCVTGMIFPAEIETPAQEWIEQYGGFSKGYRQRIFDLHEHRIRHPLYPYAAGWFGSGASMAFDTAILRELGGFDPATGAGTLAQGGDDLSAFFQVVTAGYRLVYRPAAIVRHRHRRAYAGLQRQAYGYGVGLTAFFMKILMEQPQQIWTLASRAPAGLAYLISPQSRKNAKKQAGYPQELNRLEKKGMLSGPIAYLRSRRRAQKAGLFSAPAAKRMVTIPVTGREPGEET